jgi:hypothetical protein
LSYPVPSELIHLQAPFSWVEPFEVRWILLPGLQRTLQN